MVNLGYNWQRAKRIAHSEKIDSFLINQNAMLHAPCAMPSHAKLTA